MKCETADRWWNIEFNYVLKCKLGDPLGASLILHFDGCSLLLFYCGGHLFMKLLRNSFWLIRQPPWTGCYPWWTRCACFMDATLCVLSGPTQDNCCFPIRLSLWTSRHSLSSCKCVYLRYFYITEIHLSADKARTSTNLLRSLFWIWIGRRWP